MAAELYHAHHRQYTEDLPFWEELAREYGGPILELGCGSGRVTQALRRQGEAIYGLDRDAEMLRVLRREIAGEEWRRIRLVQGDMRALCFRAAFRLVILPCNTYSTLREDERRKVIAGVRENLVAGGGFAVSVPNPAGLFELEDEAEVQEEDSFAHPATGNPVQVSSGWQREGESILINWHYDHLLPDGRVERVTQQVRHHPARLEELRGEMEAGGLRVKQIYGDFERGGYEASSPYLILVAGN